jgi:hypothetical protein
VEQVNKSTSDNQIFIWLLFCLVCGIMWVFLKEMSYQKVQQEFRHSCEIKGVVVMQHYTYKCSPVEVIRETYVIDGQNKVVLKKESINKGLQIN